MLDLSAIDLSAIGIFAGKALAAILLPVGLTLTLLALAFIQTRRGNLRSVQRLVAAAIGVLTLSSSPIVANLTIGFVESLNPPTPMSDLPQADVAILLGGAIRDLKPPRQVVEIDASGNRVLYAARLFRAGKVSKIIATGGNPTNSDDPIVEADLMRLLLLEWGVPDSAIIIERRSRTTRENAVLTHKIWQANDFKSGLLVTSAAHMPRALATFKKVGMDLTPASVDVHAAGPAISSLYDAIPSGDALKVTTAALRECIGRIGYALLGRGG